MTPLSFRYVSADTKTYESISLGIMFDYPSGAVEVYDCPDGSCISIDDHEIRIQAHFKLYSAEELKNADLFCGSGGPYGSSHCVDQEAEAFTNANGIEGYKFTNTKIIDRHNEETGEFDRTISDDWGYVFPIKHSRYKSILFYVDNPTEENHKQLDILVDTFRFVDK